LRAKFTGVDPKFVCRKTIREEQQTVSPYMFFRPSFLPSGYIEKLDLYELLNGKTKMGIR
jgi:hypothetical protein